MTGSAEYRKRAQDCVELAQQVSAAERPVLLQLAQAWLGLADEREAEEADGVAPRKPIATEQTKTVVE